MTNLTNLLANVPPIEELQQLALVFSSEVNDALVAVQNILPENRQHRIQTTKLIDNRWLLNADILSEVNSGGIFVEGFSSLPQEYFPQVQVMSFDEARLLIPMLNED